MRYPEKGKVKSRLAASIGWEEATILYEKLLRRTLGLAADLKRKSPDIDIFIFFTPENRETEIRSHFPGPWDYMPQMGSHLGERMDQALRRVLAKGYAYAALIGTDIVDLSLSDLLKAFEYLKKGFTPLGPAKDGGFYLLGIDRPCPSAFGYSEWGTDGIYRRTERALLEAGFKARSITQRRDLDREEDLVLLQDKSFLQDRLSVVVPTLSSIDRLRPFLESLENQLWPGDEIIVVKGGTEIPEGPVKLSSPVRALSSAKGRGLQLNCGVQASQGNLLFFLHDDCVPPPMFPHHVRKISEAKDASLGCFQLRFDPSTPLLDSIAKWANLRSRIFKLPYGDQGIFCRKEIYYEAGGFRKPFIMEDVDFVRHCLSKGRLLILPDFMSASPGRYLRKGTLKASLSNHWMMLLYWLGVDDKKLYSIYYND